MNTKPENVMAFPVKEKIDPKAVTVESLVGMIEEIDRGMKLMVGIIADHDKRLRGLELAQRKADRRNVPVIVNQHGKPVN